MRLEEVLHEPKSDITRDSPIKWLEFPFDLCWKAIQAYLEARGVSCASPLVQHG